MGHQEATVRGTGLARAVPAGAVTMRRLRRPRSLAAIGTGAIRVVPTAHSCDLRIGVGKRPSDGLRPQRILQS